MKRDFDIHKVFFLYANVVPSSGRPCSKRPVSVCLKELTTSAPSPMNIKRIPLGMFPSAMRTSKGEYGDSGPRVSTILFYFVLCPSSELNDVNHFFIFPLFTWHCLPSTRCRKKKDGQGYFATAGQNTNPRMATKRTSPATSRCVATLHGSRRGEA